MALQTALFYRTLSTYRPVQNRHFDESSRCSAEELAAFDPDVTFEKAQIVHAPQAHFMDLHWDTILGVVAGDTIKYQLND